MLQLVRIFRGNCGDLLAADMVTLTLVYTQVTLSAYSLFIIPNFAYLFVTLCRFSLEMLVTRYLLTTYIYLHTYASVQ